MREREKRNTRLNSATKVEESEDETRVKSENEDGRDSKGWACAKHKTAGRWSWADGLGLTARPDDASTDDQCEGEATC